ncbi:hypothetical protein P7K49_029701 [Saguinus oedipus]|uniref:Rho-GAP domain-containing protein n=1 Tax=Saguinus oedipus TaxID=9490 RepID=A0ABQ9U9Z0_SAGOE|nr:hypothetical protein P7K49_029701 [Saguinus oedipus]
MVFPDNKDVLMMMNEMDEHAITDRLKLFFRELPEPFLNDKFYPTSMRVSVSTGGLAIIGGVSSLCTAAIRGCGKVLIGASTVGVRMMMSLGCSGTHVPGAPCHHLRRGLRLIVTMRSNPLPSAVISDPTAKENFMLNLPLSQLEANLLTFLFLLDHLKR